MDKWIKKIFAVMGLIIILDIATRFIIGRQIWTFASSIEFMFLVLGSLCLPIFWSIRLAKNSSLSKGIAWGRGLIYGSLTMLAYNFLDFMIIGSDDWGLINIVYGIVSIIYLFIGILLVLSKKKTEG